MVYPAAVPVMRRTPFRSAAALAALAVTRAAAAQPAPVYGEPPPAPVAPEPAALSPVYTEAPAPAPTRDAVTPDAKKEPWARVYRPWLYGADPTAPPPGHVLASMGVGYAQTNRGAAAPFAANVAHAGAVFNAGVDVGVLRWMSLHGEGLLSGEGSKGGVHGGGMLGVSFYPLPAKSPVDLSLSGGYLRELGGGNGVWGRASIAASFKAARFVVTALGSHVFEKGRDPVNILITAGASYAVIPILRLGVEYTIQDLEGLWEDEEADGGVRHFIGPTASLEITKRVRLTAGPSFGLSQGSPTVLGRMSAMYAF